MKRGKSLSLEEARRTGQLDRFCKEHPSVGDRERFYRLINAAAKPRRREAAEGTSAPDSDASCGGTRTPLGTSEDGGR